MLMLFDNIVQQWFLSFCRTRTIDESLLEIVNSLPIFFITLMDTCQEHYESRPRTIDRNVVDS